MRSRKYIVSVSDTITHGNAFLEFLSTTVHVYACHAQNHHFCNHVQVMSAHTVDKNRMWPIDETVIISL